MAMAGLYEPPAVQVILRTVDQSAGAVWTKTRDPMSTITSFIGFIVASFAD
jgi:hypothetical protein